METAPESPVFMSSCKISQSNCFSFWTLSTVIFLQTEHQSNAVKPSEIGVLSQVSRNCWYCLDWHHWFTKMTRLSFFNTWLSFFNTWFMIQTMICYFLVQSPFFTDVSNSPDEKMKLKNEYVYTRSPVVLWDMIYIFSSGT